MRYDHYRWSFGRQRVKDTRSHKLQVLNYSVVMVTELVQALDLRPSKNRAAFIEMFTSSLELI